MMNEMMQLMETGMEWIANGANWLFYEATTAQVLLILASAKAIPGVVAQVERAVIREVRTTRALADSALKDFKEILKVH